MFKKNSNLVIGTTIVFSFCVVFGSAEPSVDPYVSYNQMVAKNYVSSRYGHHKLYTDAKIWSEAASNCLKHGGYLAIINSSGEAEHLRSLLKQERKNIKNAFNDWNALIGISDYYSEGNWSTIFGQSLSSAGYSSWASYDGKVQPDNGNGDHEEDCGAITPGSVGLSDVSCFAQFAYFCEWDEEVS